MSLTRSVGWSRRSSDTRTWIPEVARMIPTKIQFRESRAEVEMFEHLRDDVSNDFTALHHVPWASPDTKRRTIEGEADFVIVHPELGALVLEVKGGTLRFNADSSLWHQTSI